MCRHCDELLRVGFARGYHLGNLCMYVCGRSMDVS
jgi:hypothetical protein